LFPYHRAAFSPASNMPTTPPIHPSAVVGKAILFAKAPLTFPADGLWQASLGRPWAINDNAEYADIPMADSRIEQGQPIMTMLARANDVTGCLEVLRIKARELERSLFG
jgi:predicted ATP-grasp superfamily ATP-dependent carboligase